jgi:hypothetical protein
MSFSSPFKLVKPGAKANRLFAPCLEELEGRVVPTAPVVLSINRNSPALPNTNAASALYTVTFDQSVSGVNAADFKVTTTGSLTATTPVVIAGSGAAYAVTVNGIHGSGDLRLDLIDDDSILSAGLALGGAGVSNGSFQGQTYSILQAFPTVVSINRTAPTAQATNETSVRFTVTFSTTVTGVDAADFAMVKTGTIGPTMLEVTPLSTSVYTATINGITGNGTLGLNLVDDGSIHDLSGNPLAAANGRAAFAPPRGLAWGSGPSSVTLGDVNGDGKPDLAIANGNYDNKFSVGVLLGNGNGMFQWEQTFAVGKPVSLALGDVNGDGKPDLAVAIDFSPYSDGNFGAVSVLLGNGDGRYQAQQTFAAGIHPSSVTIGDMNGDGKSDLAVANGHNLDFFNTVSVLLGNGDGKFQTQQTFDTDPFPRSLKLADANGDGNLDLAVANADGTVGVLLGNGNGAFQAQQTFAAGNSPRSLTLGDVNGDGKLDLAVANNSEVSVLLGNGNGTFQSRQTFAAGNSPHSLTLGDVNGDGKLDLAAANNSEVSVLLGSGNGTFQSQQTFAAGNSPGSFTLGDVNGDGKPDLAIVNRDILFDGSVSLSLAISQADFTGQTYAIAPSAATTTTLTATPNASTGGMLVTFTASVAPSPADLGAVTFKDNSAIIAPNVSVVGGVATFQTSTLTAGTHPISAEYSGAPGFTASISNTVNFAVSPTPQVVSITPNGNFSNLAGDQRSRFASLVVTFDQAVQLDAGAMALALHTKNVTFGGNPQPNGFGVVPTALNLATSDNVTWIVTFTGNTDDGADGYHSLKDGVYDFNVNAGKVHPLGVAGLSMSDDTRFTFHRLFGDIDSPSTPPGGTPGVDFSTVVNTGDNLVFRTAFNRPAPDYQASLDFDGSGIINTGDNLAFRDRFNRTLSWRI